MNDGIQMGLGFVLIASYVIGVREVGRDRALGRSRTVIALFAMAVPVVLLWYALVRIDRVRVARAVPKPSTS